MTLFSKSHLSDVLDGAYRRAAGKIENLSLRELRAPPLAGLIADRWKENCPSVPTILPNDRTGKKRDETRTVSEYGREIEIVTPVIDVSVPYRGDGQMFGVMPSTCRMLNEEVRAQGRGAEQGVLTYTMPLDPAQEPRFNRLLEDIEHNLVVMRREIETFSHNAVQRLQKLAANRKMKLETEEKVASGFSFKVE